MLSISSIIYFICRERLLAERLNARLATVRSYATSLLTSWEFDDCGEAVVVFCFKNDAMVRSSFILFVECWWIIVHNYSFLKSFNWDILCCLLSTKLLFKFFVNWFVLHCCAFCWVLCISHQHGFWCAIQLCCRASMAQFVVSVVICHGCIVAKRCEIGPRLLLITNRKWHIGF